MSSSGISVRRWEALWCDGNQDAVWRTSCLDPSWRIHAFLSLEREDCNQEQEKVEPVHVLPLLPWTSSPAHQPLPFRSTHGQYLHPCLGWGCGVLLLRGSETYWGKDRAISIVYHCLSNSRSCKSILKLEEYALRCNPNAQSEVYKFSSKYLNIWPATWCSRPLNMSSEMFAVHPAAFHYSEQVLWRIILALRKTFLLL